jgi:hypothetical protein
MFPVIFQMGDKTWYPNKVDRTIAKYLICNVDFTDSDVFCFGLISHRSDHRTTKRNNQIVSAVHP